MMDEDEIAWILMRLLRDTAYYAGDSFGFFATFDTAVQIRYARALIVALPEDERKAIADSFNQIYDSVAAIRSMAARATHPPSLTKQ